MKYNLHLYYQGSLQSPSPSFLSPTQRSSPTNSELKQPERSPSRTSWIATGSSMFLLMEPFCLTQRILLPSTVEFDESEHWKTESIHFRFPFLTSWTSTFSLLKVPNVSSRFLGRNVAWRDKNGCDRVTIIMITYSNPFINNNQRQQCS